MPGFASNEVAAAHSEVSRFYAVKSMVVFGGLMMVRIVLGMLFITGTGFHMGGLGLLWLVSGAWFRFVDIVSGQGLSGR